MKKSILLIATLLLSLPVLAGGGWTAGKKKGFVKLGQTAILANTYYNPAGDVIDITTISLFTTSLYVEYGLSNRLDVIGYLPFFTRSTLNETSFSSGAPGIPGDAVNSLGDTDIGFRYGIKTEGSIVLSASLLFGLPLGQTASGELTEGGDPRIIETGDGEFNQYLKLSASHSFYPTPAYVTVYAGINNRTEGFSDEFRAGFELGYELSDHWSAALKVDNVSSLQNGTGESNGANSVFSNNMEFLAFTPELNYHINERVGLTGNAGFALSGKRILAAPIWGAGLFVNLR